MAQPSSLWERLFSLEGKTVLVTGASGGIGSALAVAMAEAGADVGVHGQNRERIVQTCALVEQAGRRAVPLAADLTAVEACRRLINEAHERLGRLDVLINCAAMNRRKPISQVTLDDFETIVAVDIRSVYFLSQAAQPIMAAQGGGKIINISSVNSFFGLDTVSVYGLAKGAMTQVTRVMAVEWAKDNIQVNCLAPGFIQTVLSQPIWSDDHKAAWLRQRIPARRPGQPEDLVGAALLLASPASSYLTGQSIVIDGGFLAGGSWERDS